jgi:SAM-dependent methyltransferase
MKTTERFNDRVEDYIRYRPSYPREVLVFLRERLALPPGATIADVGSGTGIFSALLLDSGYRVIGVEPNAPMRAAAERMLGDRDMFRSVDATAEATTLADASVDAVVAAQAFHWFDPAAARTEFTRILRPQGWIVLLWNDRRDDDTPFAREYQQLIDRHNTDLASVDHRRITRDDAPALRKLFGGSGFAEACFENHQDLNFEGVRGRLVSSSYIPSPGAPGYDAMIDELRALFERHARQGTVRIDYDTKMYYGRPGGTP